MPQVSRWFDRKFDFGFPVELFPNVCVRLQCGILQQAIRLVDHLYFAAEHDHHHLATIWACGKRPR